MCVHERERIQKFKALLISQTKSYKKLKSQAEVVSLNINIAAKVCRQVTVHCDVFDLLYEHELLQSLRYSNSSSWLNVFNQLRKLRLSRQAKVREFNSLIFKVICMGAVHKLFNMLC